MGTWFKEVKNEMYRGLKGLNKGIPTGITKLDKVLNGVNKGIYYTLFSEGGTGKSSVAWVLIINMIDYCIANKKKIKVFLFSMEVTRISVIVKMLCYKIYKDHGILLEPNYLLSRGDWKPSKAVQDLVDTYEEYFSFLEKDILTIDDRPRSPQDIRVVIDEYALKNGKLDKVKNIYTPNNDEYVLEVFDTVGNLTTNGTSAKQTIDTHSMYCRSIYRDLYNHIPFNISHANRAISDPTRAKMGEVFPILSDIKETNMLEQDSSVVMCLFNPFKHMSTFKNLEKFDNYDITLLRKRFRCIGILKNRHGEDNVRLGCMFLGETGHISDLPRGVDMLAADYTNIRELKANAI